MQGYLDKINVGDFSPKWVARYVKLSNRTHLDYFKDDTCASHRGVVYCQGATLSEVDLVDPDAWTGVPSSVTRKTFANSGHLPFVEEKDTLLFACVEFLDAADGKATNREFKFADPLETIKEIRGG